MLSREWLAQYLVSGGRAYLLQHLALLAYYYAFMGIPVALDSGIDVADVFLKIHGFHRHGYAVRDLLIKTL